MAGKNRKDHRGRVLPPNVSQKSDHRYIWRKMIDGRQYVLTDNDLNELKKKIVRKESEIQNGIYSNAPKVTLNEWFYKWMDVYKGNLKTTTRENYFTGWKNYVKDSPIGNMQIGKIKRMHLVELYKELSEGKELATATVHNVHITIYGCLSDALDDGLISENPAINAFKKIKHKEPQRRQALSIREQELFIDFVSGNDIFKVHLPMFAFFLGTGARFGEMSGITWNDIDLQRNVININHTMHDMQDTWIDTISEILSFLTYGWSFHEIVYKRRMGNTKDPRTKSKYNDGLIGWRKLPIRAQETLYQWEYDNEDNLLGMTQQPPPDFGTFTIPIEKALLFRTKSRKNNPEGRSILRNAYRSWYFKRRIQEIEGIGIERDLAGFPVMYTPDDFDPWDENIPQNTKTYAILQDMVKSIRRDEMEGVVLPHGYELRLLSSGGTRQFDTNAIINRYDTRIAMTVLADFIFLGHDKTGSWALSSDKTELFAVAIGTFLDIICETFNSQGIPSLIDINGQHFAGITEYPKMTHGDIEDEDITKVASFIKDMTGIGVLVPDDGLEDYIRQAGHLPERTSDTRKIERTREAQQEQNQPPSPETAAGNDTEGEIPDEKVEAAKKRLGRTQDSQIKAGREGGLWDSG